MKLKSNANQYKSNFYFKFNCSPYMTTEYKQANRISKAKSVNMITHKIFSNQCHRATEKNRCNKYKKS